MRQPLLQKLWGLILVLFQAYDGAFPSDQTLNKKHRCEAASADLVVDVPLGFVDERARTNQAESYFSRLRRAEIGTHHHISGRYLHAYAREMAWREDHRRKPNGTLFMLVAGVAMAAPVSRQWKGYWQRSA